MAVKKKRWTIAKTFHDFLKLNEFLQKNSGYHVKCNLSVPTTARRFSIILLESDTVSKQRQVRLFQLTDKILYVYSLLLLFL